MSTKTLKLLNSITNTTSAAATSTQRRRNSTVVASAFGPMLQSNGQMFPHCSAGMLIHQNATSSSNMVVSGNPQQHIYSNNNNHFVTPTTTTPALSSDHQNAYHAQQQYNTSLNNNNNNTSFYQTGRPLVHQDPLKNGRNSASQFSAVGSQYFPFSFEQPQTAKTSIQQQQQQFLDNIYQPEITSLPLPFLSLNQCPEPVSNNLYNILSSNQQPTQPSAVPQLNKTPSFQGLLPGGLFFSLTPEDPCPPMCTSTQPSNTVPVSQPSNSFFPIMPVNPVVQQLPARSTSYPTGYMRPHTQRLTTAAVSAVDARDSRAFRWNRVLQYVNEVSSAIDLKLPPSNTWIMHQYQRVSSSPADDVNNKHSLWDGGSLGTNGVDDFIWDDDLQNGKRFTIPPKSEQGDAKEDEGMMFMLEPSKHDFDLAFGYEVDDSHFRPPAKRSKSNESQQPARRGLHDYLVALKTFEMSHISDIKTEQPVAVA